MQKQLSIKHKQEDDKTSETKFEESSVPNETPDFDLVKDGEKDGLKAINPFSLGDYMEVSVETRKQTIEQGFDNLIEKAEQSQKIKEMDMTGLTYKNINVQNNILMQKTNSDRFTSMKKTSFNQKQQNKFSSSGIGNFNVNTGGQYKPPFSPSPQLALNHQ